MCNYCFNSNIIMSVGKFMFYFNAWQLAYMFTVINISACT